MKVELQGEQWRAHRPHPGKEAKRYQVEEVRELLERTGIRPSIPAGDLAEERSSDRHAVSTSSTCAYEALVASITWAGRCGAGAFLFHGTPSTCAASSQSRTGCLS